MNWVKIEPGCEMPEDCEIVLISDGEDWTQACHSFGKFYPVDSEGYMGISDEIGGVSHWARVELPNN